MIHVILNKLVTEPELFAEHASAYAGLAALEARDAGLGWRRQALAFAACAALGLLALGFTCLALMLVAALPWRDMPAPWALVCVPVALWAASGASWWFSSRRPRPRLFPHLRQQWAVDAKHLHDVMRTE